MSDSNKSRNGNGSDNKTKNDNGNGNDNKNKDDNKNVNKSTNINENKNNSENVNNNMNENKNINKKKYSADELLQYAYKHNQVPVVLFAKDKECRYIYTSEIEPLIKSGEEHSILGKTDMDIHYNAGDQYLRAAAKLLKENAFGDSVVIRWGGDEFVIVTPVY